MCHQYICLSNATYIQWVHMHISENCISIYTSYQLSPLKVTTKTTIHIFHINYIHSWPNMPATLHIHVPLHTNSTLLHIWIKQASQYAVSSEVICKCTVYLITILFIIINEHIYSLFGRHFVFYIYANNFGNCTQMYIMSMKC